jgi:hypothetical protein
VTEMLIHANASRTSLGGLRVWVFGIWFVDLLLDPLHLLALLPQSAFLPPGYLRFAPDPVVSALLHESSLTAFKLGLLGCLAVVVLGLVPTRWFAVLTVIQLIVYQGLVRGFSGHMNHAEMALLYSTLLLCLFPMFDGLSVRRPRKLAADRTQYQAAFVTVCVLLALVYFATGTVRAWKGVELFTDGTLANLVAQFAATRGELHADVYALPPEPFFLHVPEALWNIGFVGATVLEIIFPIVLFSRRARLLVVPAMLIFHASTIVLMGVLFIENMLLLPVFFDRWYVRFANRAEQLGGHSAALLRRVRSSRKRQRTHELMCRRC